MASIPTFAADTKLPPLTVEFHTIEGPALSAIFCSISKLQILFKNHAQDDEELHESSHEVGFTRHLMHDGYIRHLLPPPTLKK